MRNQQYNRQKSHIRNLRQLIEERAAYDRRVINDLRQQLHAATVSKSTEMDVLINKLHTAAKAMAEQARQENARLCESQSIVS